MSNATSVIVILGLAFATGCASSSYSSVMQKKLMETLGSDFKDYAPFSYPTDNFGLITAYATSDDRATLRDEDFLCDMWNCIGIATPPAALDAQLALAGFAAVGNSGPTITLTDNEQKSIALKAILPSISSVLGISGALDSKRVTNSKVTMKRAYPRKLRKQQLTAYLDQLPANNPLKQAYAQGRLVVVVADVVVEGVTLEITLDQQGSAALDAKFADGATTKIVKGASLSAAVARSSNGKYTMEITQPVVVRRLAKHQPTAGELGVPGDEWAGWTTAKQTSVVPKTPNPER